MPVVPLPALKPLEEILYLRDNGAFRPFFTVNLSALEVDLQNSAGGPQVFFNGDNFLFTAKDNILITEIGIRLPFCFSFGSTSPRFDLFWASEDNNETIALNCSGNIPLNSEPITLASGDIQGFYAPFPEWQVVAKTMRAKLRVALSFGKVSMVYAPTVFSGDLKVDLWVKIQHLLPLAPTPP